VTWTASNLASWVKSATIEEVDSNVCPMHFVLKVEAYSQYEDYFLTLTAAKRAFAEHFKGEGRTKWETSAPEK
jgi:hypothetical protein